MWAPKLWTWASWAVFAPVRVRERPELENGNLGDTDRGTQRPHRQDHSAQAVLSPENEGTQNQLRKYLPRWYPEWCEGGRLGNLAELGISRTREIPREGKA